MYICHTQKYTFIATIISAVDSDPDPHVFGSLDLDTDPRTKKSHRILKMQSKKRTKIYKNSKILKSIVDYCKH